MHVEASGSRLHASSIRYLHFIYAHKFCVHTLVQIMPQWKSTLRELLHKFRFIDLLIIDAFAEIPAKYCCENMSNETNTGDQKTRHCCYTNHNLWPNGWICMRSRVDKAWWNKGLLYRGFLCTRKDYYG